MARGDVFPSEKREFEQPETGARVLQLTDQPCRNVNAYYNHEQFINGSERLVFHSDRTGVRQLYSVDLTSGQIVQLTDTSDGLGSWAVDTQHDVIYYSHGGQIFRLDPEALTEEVVADTPPDCSPIALQDVSSCGRFLVLSARPSHLLRDKLPKMNFKHGSENMVILCDTQRREQAVVYHGPTPEVPVAADSHLLISRGDPCYVWFGSYTRMRPTGFKTAWVLECDLYTLMPTRDPRPLFDQRPNEFINHYYPAPDAHAQMPLYVYSESDRDGVPIAKTRPGAVSRAGNYHPMMLDVDMVSGTTRRYLFPGQPPLHFQSNNADSMWAGDCADPGFLWFAGRDAEERRVADVDPEVCPGIPGNHDFHWLESGAWIGVFQKRGPYLEMRPLVRHDTRWQYVHPHPRFSPDDKWIVYSSGDRSQTQVFVVEAVWPRWFS